MNRSNSGVSSSLVAVAVAVALVIGAGASYAVTVSTIPPVTNTVTATRAVTQTLTPATPPSVVVNDQQVKDDTVIVDLAYLDKPGFVAMHIITHEGKTGKVIGASGLLREKNSKVAVKITDYRGRGELIALMHYDNGDGTFTLGPDAAVVVDGVVVLTKFKLLQTVPGVVAGDQQIKAGSVVVDGFYLDKPGYVVIHQVTADGAPGKPIGYAGLTIGQNDRVRVYISDYDGQRELVAMLHYDNGNGKYEFPGPDGPAVFDGNIVFTKFKVTGISPGY